MHFLIKVENYFSKIKSIEDKEIFMIADLIKHSTVNTDIMLAFPF